MGINASLPKSTQTLKAGFFAVGNISTLTTAPQRKST
jgi:hypothetical protein